MPLRKRSAFSVLILAGLLATGCGLNREVVFSGNTMGTGYQVKVVASRFNRLAGLKKKIDLRLREINQSMSTYIPDSEISRFNAFSGVGRKFQVSEDFMHVMKIADRLHRLSEGAWDGTVHPIVNRWGFGSSGKPTTTPDPPEITRLLNDTGFHRIGIVDERHLVKHHASVALDLGSIAKGYAVDQVAALIRKETIDRFLVEIGGEVYASGFRLDGKPWRVGINRPDKNAPYDQVYRVVALRDRAMATSGDYRNFVEIGEKQYSHVIDPRTGRPVDNGVVSVSVIADNCTLADGLATAVMVLGPHQGVAMVDRLANAECLVVVRNASGGYSDYFSKGFQDYLAQNPKSGA